MTKKPNNHTDPHSEKQIFLKNQRVNYMVFPVLVVIFFGLVLAFQNCKSVNEPLSSKEMMENNQDSIAPITPSSMITSADKAVFSIHQKHEEQNTISNILWQVKDEPCHGESEIIATGTDVSLEISKKSAVNVSVEAFIQFEGQECITYKEQEFQDTDIICTTVYTFEDFKRDHNPWEILAVLSSDEMFVSSDNFPAGSVVDLEFVGEEHEWEGELNPLNFLDFTSFQWSIKKVGDQTELADLSNTVEGITYTFSKTGVYDVSVEASLADDDTEDEQFSEDPHEQDLYNEIKADGGMTRNSKLIIGKCEEKDAVDIEVSFK